MLLHEVIEAAAARDPDGQALVIDGVTHTFGEVAADVAAFAAGVASVSDPARHRGVAGAERLRLSARVLRGAAGRAGAAPAQPAVAPAGVGEPARAFAGERAHCSTGSCWPSFAPGQSFRPQCERSSRSTVKTVKTVTSASSSCVPPAEKVRSHRHAPTDPAWLMYTSGTTGPTERCAAHASRTARRCAALRPAAAHPCGRRLPDRVSDVPRRRLSGHDGASERPAGGGHGALRCGRIRRCRKGFRGVDVFARADDDGSAARVSAPRSGRTCRRARAAALHRLRLGTDAADADPAHHGRPGLRAEPGLRDDRAGGQRHGAGRRRPPGRDLRQPRTADLGRAHRTAGARSPSWARAARCCLPARPARSSCAASRSAPATTTIRARRRRRWRAAGFTPATSGCSTRTGGCGWSTASRTSS